MLRDPAGGRMSPPPVERHHLEMAKRNIEQHFVAAAPLEGFTSMLLLLRRLYGWKLQQVFFVRRNVGAHRDSKKEPISAASRRLLEATNPYDMELYGWVKSRFAEQMSALEPDLSRELRRFERLNDAAQRVQQIAPEPVRKLAARLLFSRRKLS
jgi:hypothetical protein